MTRQRTSYRDVLDAAENLPSEDRQRLLEELQLKAQSLRPYGIKDLRGFGKGVWQDPATGEPIDAQGYVRYERESWRG